MTEKPKTLQEWQELLAEAPYRVFIRRGASSQVPTEVLLDELDHRASTAYHVPMALREAASEELLAELERRSEQK